MNSIQTCIFITLLTLAGITESLSCAKLCTFIQLPINNSIPIDACTNITKNNTQCSVYVEIDHQNRTATGRAGIEECSTIPTQRIDTIVTLDSLLFSIIRYTCMEENCDAKFLHKLFPFNSTVVANIAMIKGAISDQIYNSTFGRHTITCYNGEQCPDSNFCQASFTYHSTPNEYELNKNFSCMTRLRDRQLLNIKQNYNVSSLVTTEIMYRCNLPNCIDKKIALNLSTWIHNENISLSIDFPEAINPETCPEATSGISILVLSHSLIIFVTIFLLSY